MSQHIVNFLKRLYDVKPGDSLLYDGPPLLTKVDYARFRTAMANFSRTAGMHLSARKLECEQPRIYVCGYRENVRSGPFSRKRKMIGVAARPPYTPRSALAAALAALEVGQTTTIDAMAVRGPEKNPETDTDASMRAGISSVAKRLGTYYATKRLETGMYEVTRLATPGARNLKRGAPRGLPSVLSSAIGRLRPMALDVACGRLDKAVITVEKAQASPEIVGMATRRVVHMLGKAGCGELRAKVEPTPSGGIEITISEKPDAKLPPDLYF